MKRGLIRTLCCGLLLAGFSLPAQAEGWFLGGGIFGSSFEDDLERIDTGVGLTFSGGYQFDELLSAEILAGFAAHDEALFDNDLVQFSILTGIKFSMGGDKFRPYGSVGLSLNVIEFGDFDDLEDEDDFEDFREIDGFGLYAGFGADIFVARSHAINIGFRTNRWTGKGDNIDVDVRNDMLTLSYAFYLSR
jgi:hypothetical protein